MATRGQAVRRSPAGRSAPGHPSQSSLTIDLAAVAANYRILRQQLRRPATCAAVVKADAYGLGAERVVPALGAAGCREFFVAHLEEAEAIRRVVPAGAAICVLNGLLAGEEAVVRRRGFIPVLNDLSQLECWQQAARSSARPLPAILHVDTGMSRLGLPPDAAMALAAPGRLQGLALHAVISHLACSEEPDQPLNAQQLRTFQTVRAAFPQVRASLANSSGIFLDPAY
ncbi:MAG: alanine racemase, partial [Alphaproteobacteria bacterium]|nr:alanine racemase [Alphaproteobacteria bacterium]